MPRPARMLSCLLNFLFGNRFFGLNDEDMTNPREFCCKNWSG